MTPAFVAPHRKLSEKPVVFRIRKEQRIILEQVQKDQGFEINLSLAIRFVINEHPKMKARIEELEQIIDRRM